VKTEIYNWTFFLFWSYVCEL